jgi:hypothetical protein
VAVVRFVPLLAGQRKAEGSGTVRYQLAGVVGFDQRGGPFGKSLVLDSIPAALVGSGAPGGPLVVARVRLGLAAARSDTQNCRNDRIASELGNSWRFSSSSKA